MTQITIPNVATEVTYSVTSSSTGPYVVPFPFFVEEDVFALVTDALGVETTLVVTTDFTFTGLDVPVGQEGSGYEGGSITLNTAIGADGATTIKIYRSIIVDRTSNYPSTGPFSVVLLNDEQNKHIAIMQELTLELSELEAKFPSGDLADFMFSWDASGNPEANISAPDIRALLAGSVNSGVLLTADTYTGDGTTTDYTITVVALSANSVLVTLDGVTQIPSTDYIVSGTTLTFVTAPPDGTSILIRNLGTSNIVDVGDRGAIGLALWPQTLSEIYIGVTPTDYAYPPGYIERYGGVGDGTTDATTALAAANSVGRHDIKFYEAGRTDVLNTYVYPHNFYIIRDGYLDNSSLIGPANFASDGTQVESMLRLGQNLDYANGAQYRARKIEDINFSGKLRVDNGISFGADLVGGVPYPETVSTSWSIERCAFDRCNIAIKKPNGNFGQRIDYTIATNGNYGYWARGYPIRSTISVTEAVGQTVLSVTDTSFVSVGDVVRVFVDDGSTHLSTITDVTATTVTIADAIDDQATAGAVIKFYHPDDAVSTTLSHVGTDYILGGEYSGMRKAAFYIDGQNAVGTGQTVLQNVIIENNPGFGIFVKDYNNSYTPLHLKNVWFELNAQEATNTAEDDDSVALTQTPSGAGDFTLNGAFTSSGVFDADNWFVNTGPRQLSFTSDGDESADSYTITGTDQNGDALVEVISGPNTTTVNSVNSFQTVTQIATDGAGTGNITIGTTRAVDFNDGFGPREPQAIYFENVDNALVQGSNLRGGTTVIDSNVQFDACTMVGGITELTIANTDNLNHVRFTNMHINGWGESYLGAKDIEIESLARSDRKAGNSLARCWRARQLTPISGNDVQGGEILESDRGDGGEDWLNTGYGDVARNAYVEGLSYPTASQYIFPVGAYEFTAPATQAVGTTTAGKWYVCTQEIKVDANLADLSALKWGGGFNFTRGNANDLLTEGEWSTIAFVGELDTGTSGNTRMMATTTATGTGPTITFGASQIVEFDDAQDAYDYYNKGVHTYQYKSATKVKRSFNPNRASTTTLADDPELEGWNLEADTWYRVTGSIILDTSTSADFKWLFDFSQTVQVLNISAVDLNIGFNGVTFQTESAAPAFVNGAVAYQQLKYEGIFQSNATTGGDMAFQWAQNSSNTYQTRVEKGSWLKVERLIDQN
jgi:hypothetical protein